MDAVMQVADGVGRGLIGAVSYTRRSGRLPRGGEASVESWSWGGIAQLDRRKESWQRWEPGAKSGSARWKSLEQFS